MQQPPAIDVIDLVDVTDDGTIESHKRRRDSSSEPRRTHRKTESRVFFGEVMAQEREMERLHYEMSRQQLQSSSFQLRKDETMMEQSTVCLMPKRTEKRRSARQNLRRKRRSCSSDGKVSLLKEKGPVRRITRNQETVLDVVLHSTAWRNVKLKDAPSNLLPDRKDLLQPFAIEMRDIPLDEFDEHVKRKCQVSRTFLKPKLLTMTSGTLGEARDMMQMDEKVRAVIDEATPLIKKCHAARVKAIVANTRQQIAAYLEDRSVVRAKMLSAIVAFPLQISWLEEVAARRLLRDAEFMLDSEDRPHYSVERNESGYSEQVYPRTVTYLRKITPLPRSTTCMLVWGTHRCRG
ncbi:unnamed protein product [Peronospora destructor]|uniref:Uncharacterized protein n=1 Tax=Peronospora destructor TaxID=86335 RepID=A0AAV0U231_9STRA|nr:unnamed protein product [Peronospora destructor]